MLRRKPNKRKSHNAFKRRVGKTARINLAEPKRGGIRL